MMKKKARQYWCRIWLFRHLSLGHDTLMNKLETENETYFKSRGKCAKRVRKIGPPYQSVLASSAIRYFHRILGLGCAKTSRFCASKQC